MTIYFLLLLNTERECLPNVRRNSTKKMKKLFIRLSALFIIITLNLTLSEDLWLMKISKLVFMSS